MSRALNDIAAERRRQMDVEGWSAPHDDAHSDGEIARAAAAYAVFAGEPRRFTQLAQSLRSFIPVPWPWSAQWWKPSPDNRRNLVKAGALIVAEIERLDRRSMPVGEGPYGHEHPHPPITDGQLSGTGRSMEDMLP